MVCRNCGEYLEGDGYTTALHCPNADEAEYEYNEPDANPVYCTTLTNKQLGPVHYRYFCRSVGDTITIRLESYIVVGETPLFWYVVPSYMEDYPEYVIKNHRKRVSKDGSSKFCRQSKEAALADLWHRQKRRAHYAGTEYIAACAGLRATNEAVTRQTLLSLEPSKSATVIPTVFDSFTRTGSQYLSTLAKVVDTLSAVKKKCGKTMSAKMLKEISLVIDNSSYVVKELTEQRVTLCLKTQPEEVENG